MAENDWRPRDAAERARRRDHTEWRTSEAKEPAAPSEKDTLFTSEEAVAFDRDVVQRYDPAKDTWVPHQPATPDYDLDLREEKRRGDSI